MFWFIYFVLDFFRLNQRFSVQFMTESEISGHLGRFGFGLIELGLFWQEGYNTLFVLLYVLRVHVFIYDHTRS